MKKLFEHRKKNNIEEFKTIDATIKQIKLLKENLSEIILALSNEQNYEEIVKEEGKRFMRRLNDINKSWNITKTHLNVLDTKRSINFTFIEEMNKISEITSYNRLELFSHYNNISKILTKSIYELEEYKRRKIFESNH